MDKLFDLVFDAIDAARHAVIRITNIFWEGVNAYQAGFLQEYVQARLAYLSWILIGLAMFLVATISHYIGWETLRTEIMILLILVGIRYAARAGV